MPYWYWRGLKSAWAIDENTTNRFMLPEQGAISGLWIRRYGTTATHLDNLDDIQPIQLTSKLRIVGNGNFEVVNCRGKQLHAIDYWNTGVPDPDSIVYWNGNTAAQNFFLPFGRYPGDPKYGLWLEKFAAGVEFEETNTVSTTYYTDATSKYDIYALMRKNPEASMFSGGFLRKRNIVTKDAASETQYAVKLPTNNKLRQIHLFSEPTIASGVQSTDLFTLAQRIWLSIKSKDEFLWDNQISGEIAKFMHRYYGRYPETDLLGGSSGNSPAINDTFIYYCVTHLPVIAHALACYAKADVSYWLERCASTYRYNDAGEAQGSITFYNRSRGLCLHGDIPLLMQDPMGDETEWLDAGVNKDVYVEVTEGSSSGNWYLVLDELEKQYPT